VQEKLKRAIARLRGGGIIRSGAVSWLEIVQVVLSVLAIIAQLIVFVV
jgi:hypothetical protein